MWVRHHSFKSDIARVWEADTGYQGMMNLLLKLVRIKKFLKVWNREVFGNVFDRLKSAEAAGLEAETVFDADPTPVHRASLNKATTEFTLRAKVEEDYWKQKAAVRWAVEGERNSKFFHGWVRQKRVKSRVHMIEAGGQVLTEEDDVKNSAAEFFQQLLTSDVGELAQPDLSLIHRLPESIDREGLFSIPEAKEVRDAVFAIIGDSVSSQDGSHRCFFSTAGILLGVM